MKKQGFFGQFPLGVGSAQCRQFKQKNHTSSLRGRSPKQSRILVKLDCFASLAMTENRIFLKLMTLGSAHSRQAKAESLNISQPNITCWAKMNVLSSESRGQNLFWTMPSHEKRLNLLNIPNNYVALPYAAALI
jgi:hypothetical protein